MSTTVKASCFICGDLELRPAQIELVTYNLESMHEQNHYTFTCAGGHHNAKDADSAIIKLLDSAPGIRRRVISVPLEYLDPVRASPYRLTWDDLLDTLNDLDVLTRLEV